MDAHTCNCQEGLAASSCYSVGPYGPAAAYGQQTLQLPPTTSMFYVSAVFVSHSDSRYEVSSLVVVGAGGRSLHRRAHAVLVVLADEDARQLPQGGHVEGLENLALGW